MDPARLWKEKYVPLIQQAQSRESEDDTFLWLGINDDICGVEVRPFTLRILLLLQYSENGFFIGKEITLDDILQFLWVISIDYTKGPTKGAQFYKRVGKTLILEDAIIELTEYLEKSLGKRNPDNGDNKDESTQEKTPEPWIASMIDNVAHNYGWTIDQIIDTPIMQLMQLCKAIRKRTNPSSPSINPSIDDIKSQYMKECALLFKVEKKK
jgi:hypothetical protein